MILGRTIEQVRAGGAGVGGVSCTRMTTLLIFFCLIMSPDPYFTSFAIF